MAACHAERWGPPSSERPGSRVSVSAPRHPVPMPPLRTEQRPQTTDGPLLPLQGFFVSVFYCFLNGEV